MFLICLVPVFAAIAGLAFTKGQGVIGCAAFLTAVVILYSIAKVKS